jgi:hypothetical protein
MEKNAVDSSQRRPIMPDTLSPLEAAEKLEWAAEHIFASDNMGLSDCEKAARLAASLLRKIANKRLVDKDELLKIFGQYVERRGEIICNEMGLQDILDIVEDAPEVISFKNGSENFRRMGGTK